MGKVRQFSIVFDHPQAVYRTGETVRGNVVLSLSEPMKLKNVRIIMRGLSGVKYKLPYYNANNKSPQFFRATTSNEVYFQKTIDLFGAGNEEDKTLEAGEYSYNFSLVLNPGLPSSFEAEKGYVRYFCKAMVMQSMGRPDQIRLVTKAAFSVVSMLDLNQEPMETQSPITKVITIKPDGCCVDGAVKTTLTINKSAFVSGEYILINAKVENSSNTEVEILRASIKQYVEFFGNADSYEDGLGTIFFPKPYTSSRFVSSVEIMVNVSKGSCNYENVKLQVPAVPPTRLQGCKNINMLYKIKFYIKVNHEKETELLSCDLVIGTIPRLDAACMQCLNVPTTMPVTTQPTGSKLPGYEEIGGIAALWDIAPPSYEESVFGRGHIQNQDDNDDIGGNLNWAPHYPFYSNITEGNNTNNNNQPIGNTVTTYQPIASNVTMQQPTIAHGTINNDDNIERNGDSITRL